MTRKKAQGKMSQDQRNKISASVIASAAQKRKDQGLHEVDEKGINIRTKEIELIQMKNQTFDPDLFVPMKTQKGIDVLFSNQGGIPKACNFIIIGDPGVGKTTVSMDILSDLREQGYKCLFISAEMTKIDLYEYCKRYPKFNDLDILFLGEYLDDNPKEVVEKVLIPGFDVVLLDSFAEIQAAVKEANKLTNASSEKWLIDIMLRHNLGANKTDRHTTFLAVQQVTKEGGFVGSNKLKHNTTGMMELRFEDDTGLSSWIQFTKNRRGPVNRKMYFNLQSTTDVEYDSERFDNDISSIREDGQTIDNIFKLTKLEINNEDNIY